jgi:phosphoglycolate phosphatase
MHILLDLDGTLIDPRPGIVGSVQHALTELGETPPPADELTWAIGPPLRTTFTRLLGPGRAEAAVALYRQHYGAGAMYDVLVYAGIPEALAALRDAGLRLVVVTAKPHVFAVPIMERVGLMGHVSGLYGPELDGTRDDKAHLLAHALESEGIAAADAIMVGDRAFDMTAAARNGVRALGVTWGYGSVAELAGAGATALCTAPARLPASLASLIG